MDEDYIPGVWDYLTTRFLGWKPKESLTYEQIIERWQKHVNGATILEDLTKHFRGRLPIVVSDSFTTSNDDAFRHSFQRWATKGQHDTASQTWNFNSTKSFLTARLPDYKDVSISEATRVIHRSISFWTQYPMVARQRDVLDEDDIVRAVGFLTDCDRTLFRDVSADGQSLVVRWEPDQRDDEDTFRSLAIQKSRSHHSIQPNPDIIGVLSGLQPKPDDGAQLQGVESTLPVQALTNIAQRISHGKYPLQSYYIPKTEFLSLLRFLIIMLGCVDTRIITCQELLEEIHRFRENIETIASSDVSWQQIIDLKTSGMRAVKVALNVLFRRLLISNDVEIWKDIRYQVVTSPRSGPPPHCAAEDEDSRRSIEPARPSVTHVRKQSIE